MGKVLPSQQLLKQFEEPLVFGEMNLSEIVRSGPQMMLQYALERVRAELREMMPFWKPVRIKPGD